MAKWSIITCKDKLSPVTERYVIDEQKDYIVSGIIPAYVKYLKFKRSGKYDFVSISRF